ncbi:MAG TPA: 50S ribosomal protein L10 [Candidatus Paceibacterota bacterium]|nr:50S ribosomal protein L10 [Candidatus Paceibacterota bacterium]
MAITKDKKRDIIAKLDAAFAEAKSIAFVGFTKLSVADSSKLRKELKEKGVSYYVAKKTLVKRALSVRGYEGSLPELGGEIAVAWTTGDETAPARGVHEFGKKLKGALTLLGGVFENAYLTQEGIKAIATIPPMIVLRGMFVNVVNSPIQGLVIALDKIREKKAA